MTSFWVVLQGTAGKAGPRGQRGPTVCQQTTSKLLNKEQCCLRTLVVQSAYCVCHILRVLVVEEVPEVQPENLEQRSEFITTHLTFSKCCLRMHSYTRSLSFF